MKLSEWCELVPHGRYFQPIRLTLEGPDKKAVVAPSNDELPPTPASPPAEQQQTTEPVAPSTPPPSVAPPAAPSTPSASVELAAAPSTPVRSSSTQPAPSTPITTSIPGASPGQTTPKRLRRRAKPAPATPTRRDSTSDSTVTVPPFESAHVDAGRMVLNVGGPVWAMDWVPPVKRTTASKRTGANAKTDAQDKENDGPGSLNGADCSTTPAVAELQTDDWRLLALSTHPPCQVKDGELVRPTPPDHYYDATEGGRGLIQIWAVPVQTEAVTTGVEKANDAPLPRLVYAIDHSSGVAWDLQWCPLPHKIPRWNTRGSGLLGVLAVCFGDGSLQLFDVPAIDAAKLHRAVTPCNVERLTPVITGRVDRAIQLSVQWSPHSWYLLLTGCSDGAM
ncbi:hypothetical protein PINS_up005696 [Pythium insidiosum]|nr:hypothetical protein PINS_up005696 [Pythium insidiosum]